MAERTRTFLKLYKKTSTGKIQTWEVRVELLQDNTAAIITSHGQHEGKIQVVSDPISEGKNIGKANETSPFEQACLQAESDWKGKLKKGYVDNIEDAEAGKTDDIIEGGIFPMLAHKFSEQGHKIVYPAIAQPKLDGCVDGLTIIDTNIGKLHIQDIVDKNINCMIKAYDIKGKCVDYKKILNRMKNGVDINEPNVQWYEIETDDGRTLKVTGNHLVYLPKLKCWRRVDELMIDDKILNVF